MNKQDLITLLKSAECGSDELNVAYYEWKYPEYVIAYSKYMRLACRKIGDHHIESVDLNDLSRSVDAALVEIPTEYAAPVLELFKGLWYVSLRKSIIGKTNTDCGHKSLPIAILLAVVEAAP